MESNRTRSSLPIHNMKAEIMDAIHNNPVVLIRGNTGCGKTTQVSAQSPDLSLVETVGLQCFDSTVTTTLQLGLSIKNNENEYGCYKSFIASER